MSLKRYHLHKIIGGIFTLLSLLLIVPEYNTIFASTPNANQQYIDFSILLYIGRWIIYLLLLLAGIFTFFKSKGTYVFLLIFSLTVLLEVYLNESVYIVKSMEGLPEYLLLITALTSILIIILNVFSIKKISLSGIFLSISLAMLFVYLPNALITFYF